jgi:quinol monooxygenase YgiN
MAIYFIVNFEIKQGKLDSFKQIAQSMIAATQKEPGALGFEWYFSADAKRCRVVETYADQAAVRAHADGGAVKLIPGIVETATMSSFEVCGDPGPENAAKLQRAGAEIVRHWQGLKRS